MSRRESSSLALSAVFVIGVVAAVWLLLSVSDSSRVMGEVPPVGAPIAYPTVDVLLVSWTRTQMAVVATMTPMPTTTPWPSPTLAPYEAPTPTPFVESVGSDIAEPTP